MNIDYVFKLIIVGDSLSGKSSLMNRACNNTFTNYYEATIGVDFLTKINRMHDGKHIKTHIWDTAGQKCFSNILKSYYKGTAGIIYVFDKSNKISFQNIKYWMNEVYSTINTNISSILIATKTDKVSKVTSEEAAKFASDNGMLYVETSAKNKINTSEFLDIFITNIYYNMNEDMHEDMPGIKKVINRKTPLRQNQKRTNSWCCWC